ncbi:MAG TPA: T9SS type A sorting domain-containing protein [Candidatus Parabacteroides intestinigallinarum]|uniref:T9SS type A sorting domain-containing protein n=1 Tax=Candidatus Parabacteroides intestinigallinarum TaxID=2838722 RepID=A0A9D1XPI2_9BACT|nr:T9SS type A sorting domain-containing protein [Candidatus Parabacteroides intestinigallinarum]
MKKIFTSISVAAAALFLSVAPTQAQQRQITDQEKVAFVKAAVPAMLDQFKQITGIDIVSFANPDIKDVISSPLFGVQNGMLRAATTTSLTLQPDSVILDLSNVDLGLDGMMGGLAGQFLNSVKLTFGEYKDFTMTTPDGQGIEVSIPQTISTNLLGMFDVSLNVAIGDKTGLLPFNSLSANLDLGGLDAFLGSMGIESGSLFTMKETGSNGKYAYDITLGETLRALIASGMIAEDTEEDPDATIEITIPENVLINVDMSTVQTSATIDASVSTVQPTATLPMGDATVYLNAKELLNGGFKTDSIVFVSYEDGEIADYDKVEISNTVELDKNAVKRVFTTYYKDETTNGEWKFDTEKTRYWVGNHELDNKNLIYSLMQGLIADMTAGTLTTSFELVTTTKVDDPESEGVITEIIDAETSMGTEGGLINILVDDGNEENGEILNVEVNIPLNSKTVSAAFKLKSSDSPIATLYLTSNMMSIITDNEAIENDVQALKVSSTPNGLYVQNGKGNYVIINMVGKVVANGIITSDQQYINLSIPKGIYMISINQEGEQKTIKFAK